MKASLIVHGGAWDITPDLLDAHQSACKAALLEGWEILESGGDALDAVEKAVTRLEDDPNMNAGTGSVLNARGEIELDASMMEGKELMAGAVAAVRNIKNPVSLARRVLHTETVLLVDRGASLFAREVGMPECSQEELIVERELLSWRALQDDTAPRSQGCQGGSEWDTVGAVGMDKRGNIVAANSTGGRPYKHPGRVGDSPLIGCGIYADNSAGGAACTGWGEYIIRLALAKTAVDMLRDHVPVQQAATVAVELLREKVGGLGGLIMIDRNGDIGYSYGTAKMAHAYLTEDLTEPAIGL